MKKLMAGSGVSPSRYIFLTRLFLVASVFIVADHATARPRPPWPLLPEFFPPLYSETFDHAFDWSATNAQVSIGKHTYEESWSGYALQRTGAAVAPFFVPALDSKGCTNVNGSQGTIRFWFKPDWASVTQAKGTGPGNIATLLELEAIGKGESATVWTLAVNPDGTALSLFGQGDDRPTVLLQTEINWLANQSHLIVLDYGPKETALLVDGQLVAQGAGVVAVPPEVAALLVGSSLAGRSVAGGDFDELFCFGAPTLRWGRPLTAEDVLFYYQVYGQNAALGPITAEEIAAREKRLAERRAQAAAAKIAGLEEGEGMAAMARGAYGALSGDCETNGPLSMTNVWAGFETDRSLTVTFDIVGGTNGFIYDVFGTTNLAASSITNIPWAWVTNSPTCSTVVLTNQPTVQTYYILGTPLDSDEDGWTDAYERLVSHSDPTVWDTDGDGYPDGWKDTNGNDIPDWLEVLLGFDPTTANGLGNLSTPGYVLFLAEPKPTSKLP